MNDRFKFRIYDLEQKHYLRAIQDETTGAEGFAAFYGKYNNICKPMSFFLCHDIDRWVIEQCTGLSDKNRKLIYEGDIIDCELQNIDSYGYPFIHFKKGVVKRAKNGVYCVEGDDDFYASDITLYPIEIIGNIHKQAEQKDKRCGGN